MVILATLSTVHRTTIRDMGHETLLTLGLFHSDDLGVESVLSRAIDTSQSSQSDSCLEVVRSLEYIGQECVEYDAEDSCVDSMRVLFQGEGSGAKLGVDRKENRILCLLQV